MRYNKRLIPVTLIICIFLFVLCASCAKQGIKTVVIEDNAPASSVNEDQGLHDGKVYKFNYFNVIDNKPVNEMLFGWLDKDNTAAVVGRQDEDLTIEAINYKYHFSKEIMTMTSDISSYGLSPDGKEIAYIKGEKLYSKETQGDKDKEIGQIDLPEQTNASISWSNNGRFIMFTVSGYPVGIERIYIYDNAENEMHKIELKEMPAAASELIHTKALNYNVMISDDGTKLLINSIYDNSDYKVEYLAHLYQLDKETFLPETEIFINQSNKVNSQFIDNNRLIYLDMRNGSLDIYHTDTGEDNEICKLDKSSMKYPYFRVSNDGKAIVFIKYLADGTVGIYEAGIQNSKLEDERMIYRDFLPSNIWWSGDNKKVLLSGRYAYSERVDNARQLSPSYVSLGSIIVELN